jgi:hypothetical protein
MMTQEGKAMEREKIRSKRLEISEERKKVLYLKKKAWKKRRREKNILRKLNATVLAYSEIIQENQGEMIWI